MHSILKHEDKHSDTFALCGAQLHLHWFRSNVCGIIYYKTMMLVVERLSTIISTVVYKTEQMRSFVITI